MATITSQRASTVRRTRGVRRTRAVERSRGIAGMTLAAVLAGSMMAASVVAQEAARSPDADWPTYNRDLAGTRYSPLDQIDTGNVAELAEAWSYRFHPDDGFIEGPTPTELFQQVTPIVVDGVMYLAAGNRVVALRPETGEEIWRPELAEGLASFRGVAYGPGTDAHGPRIYFTSLSKAIALDAATGERDRTFGGDGEVELRIPYTGVPVVYRNALILGSSAFGPGQPHIAPHLNQPRGGGEPVYAYPRALDAATGRLRWEFPTLPTESDFGSHTWGNQSWRNRIGNNVWAFTLTVDEERGLVYMPVSSPGSNFYGGDRPGDNLFANSTIAIDIATGELAWYFQNIHRDLWDYNLPPPPGLLEIERDGEIVPAVAQVGKSAFMFILNRVTGEPIHGVEERPVPAGDVPGEEYSPTQPIPLKPPPVARVSFGPDDIVTADDTTPEHASACRELWDEVGYYNEGPYTPLRLKQEGTPPTLVFPGTGGGVNWNGTAYDPELGYIFVNSKDVPISGWMDVNPEYGPDTDDHVAYVRSPGPPFEAAVFDAEGERLGALPCYKPPWARLYAVHAASGEIAWEVPLGINELLPEEKQRVGTPSVGGAIVTGGGLVFIGATTDRRFRAFDSRTGEELWSAAFDYNVEAVPITYAGNDGRQYVAANVSAPATAQPRGNERLVVFALPGR
ncbi:MAG: PQQ-binding-like beta-propeller repeat protein [Acidobacteria bacterium]|nr:PQQ-binding-like beta-propeller repeat protein [Acidobacteriota bacterium]